MAIVNSSLYVYWRVTGMFLFSASRGSRSHLMSKVSEKPRGSNSASQPRRGSQRTIETTRCRWLKCVEICWNVLKFVEICWNVLKHVEMCWNNVQKRPEHGDWKLFKQETWWLIVALYWLSWFAANMSLYMLTSISGGTTLCGNHPSQKVAMVGFNWSNPFANWLQAMPGYFPSDRNPRQTNGVM